MIVAGLDGGKIPLARSKSSVKTQEAIKSQALMFCHVRLWHWFTIPPLNVVMHERRNEILISIVQCRGVGMAEQGLHSGESAPPPLWPRLDIPTRYHLWNQLLVGSRLNPRFCKGFSRII